MNGFPIASRVQPVPTWRREPYRLLFPLGFLLAWAGVLHWLLFALGITTEYRAVFHSMAQIQGFLACFAAGFLFTMIPRRTGTAAPAPWQMAVALGAPVGTTVCAWFEQFAVAQAFWLVLLAVLISFAIRRAPRAAMPPSFVWVIGGLTLGVAGAVLAGYGAATDRMWLHDVGRGWVLQGVMTGLITGIGGFLLPMILRGQPAAPIPRLVHVALVILFAGSFFLEEEHLALSFALRAAAVAPAIILGVRLWVLPTMPGLHRRMAWLAAWFVPAGYAFVAIFPAYRRIGLHVTFVGGFALLTLSISVHVILSHGGKLNLLDSTPRPLIGVAALLGFALATRMLVDLVPSLSALWLGCAAASFLAATVCWARLAVTSIIPEKT